MTGAIMDVLPQTFFLFTLFHPFQQCVDLLNFTVGDILRQKSRCVSQLPSCSRCQSPPTTRQCTSSAGSSPCSMECSGKRAPSSTSAWKRHSFERVIHLRTLHAPATLHYTLHAPALMAAAIDNPDHCSLLLCTCLHQLFR